MSGGGRTIARSGKTREAGPAGSAYPGFLPQIRKHRESESTAKGSVNRP